MVCLTSIIYYYYIGVLKHVKLLVFVAANDFFLEIRRFYFDIFSSKIKALFT